MPLIKAAVCGPQRGSAAMLEPMIGKNRCRGYRTKAPKEAYDANLKTNLELST